MPILDIDTVDAFYKGVTFQLEIVPHDMPVFTIEHIDTLENVFINLWPLRQFPMPIKHINVIAKHDKVGIDHKKRIHLFRWRFYKKWRYLRRLSRRACITRCRVMRNELLVRAVAAGKL